MVKIAYKYIIIAMVAFCVSGLFLGTQGLTSYAEEVPKVVDLATSNVYDDLKTSTINGAPFDVIKYPYNENGNVAVLNFVEYCYSADSLSNYDLYVYIYNPQQLDFALYSNSNKVQIGIGDGEKLPTDYNTYNLIYCNSSMGPLEGLFLKFKVSGQLSIAEKVKADSRNYYVSGVELFTKGATNAVDYIVGRSYIFSGYAKGFGADKNADSTLKCAVKEQDTLSLDVKSTFYRTGISDAGTHHQNQVNSVYFSVPTKYLTTYGNLQRVKAEWYEYRTQPVIVLQERNVYNDILPLVGKKLNPNFVDNNIKYSLYTKYREVGLGGVGGIYSDFAYNPYPGVLYSNYYNQIFWLFNGGIIPATDLESYAKNYNKSYVNGTLPIKENTISKDLFTSASEIGANRVYGYNCKEIDLKDSFDLNSYKTNHNWWQEFWDYGFGARPELNETYLNIPPIEEVTQSSLSGTDASKNLFVDASDLAELSSYRIAAANKEETTFLLRFANTDYFSQRLDYKNPSYVMNYDKGYIAQQNVFLDFDIIQLTFKKDGDLIVIPVVSSPIDVIADVTPPPPDVAQKIDNTILYVLIGVGIVVVASCLGVFLLKGRR